MTTYVIRRLLLMIPTFIMATMLFFIILELVPNGPVEVYLQNELSKLQMSGEAANIGVDTGTSPAAAMTDEEVAGRLKEYFGLDKALHIRYLNWLGVWPREFNQRLIKLDPGEQQQKYRLAYQDSILISIENNSVKMTRNNRVKLNCDEKLFIRIVKAGFSQKRKLLRNALKTFIFEDNNKISDLLLKRAEQLSVNQFIKLTQHVRKV